MANQEFDPATERAIRNGARMTDYILGKLQRGMTEMPARAGKLDLRNLWPSEVRRDDQAYQVARTTLGLMGVEIDTYTHYEGTGDYSDLIVVTSVDGTPVPPSDCYQHELNMRSLE